MTDRKRRNSKKPAPIAAQEPGQKPEMVTVAQTGRPAQIDGKSRRKVGRPLLEVPNAERRDSIAAAALKLFSEFGFAAVSNKELGETAGIHPALIYYYFEDKDDLFQFVVRKALTDALAAYEEIRRERGGNDSLRAWLSSNLLLSGEITRFLKVVLDYAHSSRRSPETDEAIARFYNTEVKILSDALMEESQLTSPKANELAQVMSVFLDGVMVARVVRPEINLDRLVSLMQKMLGRKKR